MRRLLIVPVLLLVVSAGCGSAGTSGTTAPRQSLQDIVLASATKTQRAGSAHVSFMMNMTGLPTGTMTMNGDGAIDMAQRRGQVVFHISSPLSELNGDMTEIMDGLVLYMKWPVLTSQIPGGKPWIKMDLEKLGRMQGIDLSSLMNTDQSDPTQALTYLRGASKSITTVGSDTIDGVTTTHYRAVVDLRKAMSRLPAAQRRAAATTIQRLIAQLGAGSMPVDVWIGSDGYVRRESLSFPMKSRGMPAGAKMSMQIDLSDFGTPVSITVPPAGQVADLYDLLTRTKSS